MQAERTSRILEVAHELLALAVEYEQAFDRTYPERAVSGFMNRSHIFELATWFIRPKSIARERSGFRIQRAQCGAHPQRAVVVLSEAAQGRVPVIAGAAGVIRIVEARKTS